MWLIQTANCMNVDTILNIQRTWSTQWMKLPEKYWWDIGHYMQCYTKQQSLEYIGSVGKVPSGFIWWATWIVSSRMIEHKRKILKLADSTYLFISKVVKMHWLAFHMSVCHMSPHKNLKTVQWVFMKFDKESYQPIPIFIWGQTTKTRTLHENVCAFLHAVVVPCR